MASQPRAGRGFLEHLWDELAPILRHVIVGLTVLSSVMVFGELISLLRDKHPHLPYQWLEWLEFAWVGVVSAMTTVFTTRDLYRVLSADHRKPAVADEPLPEVAGET